MDEETTEPEEAPEKDEGKTKCRKCPHTQEQHDMEGFCEVEDGVLGYCKCEGYDDKDAVS